MKRRIESATSRTAMMTCLSRACSALETNAIFKSGDYHATRLIPPVLRLLLRTPFFRTVFRKVIAPTGIYEYVIARTRYIDAAFAHALAEGFDQIILFGAGFDTRGIRFQHIAGNTTIFELDAPRTQQAKLNHFAKVGISIPAFVKFIEIDFDRESLRVKLEEAGFLSRKRTLFVLEGVVMYLQPESARDTFQVIQAHAGEGSRLVFDFVLAPVIRGEGIYYGDKRIFKTVADAAEQWHFGIEKEQAGEFLAGFGFTLTDLVDAQKLEQRNFRAVDGRVKAKVNGTHCLVTAEFRSPLAT